MFRERLAEITADQNVDQHRGLIAAMQPEFAHTIEPLTGEHPIGRYTCVVHAFHLIGNPTYERIATFGLRSPFAGTDFVNYVLVGQRLAELTLDAVQPGDIVMYFDARGFQHVGLMISTTRVESKWGRGHLYEHGLLEVPSTYGTQIRYFRGVEPSTGLDLFLGYAETRGFRRRR